MSVIDRIKQHYQSQTRSKLLVAEWGDENGPFEIYYDPPTLKDAHLLNTKSNGNYHLALCTMIVRKALDKNGDAIFQEGDAVTLYGNSDDRIVSRIGLEMKNHLSVEEQAKN